MRIETATRIALLKHQVASGTYQVDLDALAERLCVEEFSEATRPSVPRRPRSS
ncbi:hypothetical protein BH11MYX3_BH11MYX3_15250 [soil metagenome]